MDKFVVGERKRRSALGLAFLVVSVGAAAACGASGSGGAGASSRERDRPTPRSPKTADRFSFSVRTQAAAGRTRTQGSIAFTPAAQTLTVNGVSPASASYALIATLADGSTQNVNADSLEFDRPDLASLTPGLSVVLTTPGQYAGTGTLHAVYGTATATATLTVIVHEVDTNGVPPGTISFTMTVAVTDGVNILMSNRNRALSDDRTSANRRLRASAARNGYHAFCKRQDAPPYRGARSSRWPQANEIDNPAFQTRPSALRCGDKTLSMIQSTYRCRYLSAAFLTRTCAQWVSRPRSNYSAPVLQRARHRPISRAMRGFSSAIACTLFVVAVLVSSKQRSISYDIDPTDLRSPLSDALLTMPFTYGEKSIAAPNGAIVYGARHGRASTVQDAQKTSLSGSAVRLLPVVGPPRFTSRARCSGGLDLRHRRIHHVTNFPGS